MISATISVLTSRQEGKADLRLLGALLAGGKSRRFGRDKLVEPVGGRMLATHSLRALAAQCDALVICGRQWENYETIPDLPEGALGPLGGLNAAFAYAIDGGFDALLCAPADLIGLSDDFGSRLIGDGAAVFAEQFLVGFWPVHYGPTLDQFIRSGGRAVSSWLSHSNARCITDPPGLYNINRIKDIPGRMSQLL